MTSSFPIKSPRKLIEVALPLDAINVACAREKSIRHGHPSTLHLWWARRPLAAARADIFARFDNNAGWGVASVNYDLRVLLARATQP
jgi:putative DNA methylase